MSYIGFIGHPGLNLSNPSPQTEDSVELFFLIYVILCVDFVKNKLCIFFSFD